MADGSAMQPGVAAQGSPLQPAPFRPQPPLDAGAATAPFLAVLRAAGAAGHRVVVMRDAPGDLATLGELDLLVGAANLRGVIHLAEKGGWVLQDRGVFFPRKAALVRYHEGRLLKLDLHTAFIDRALIYMDAEAALGRAEAGPDGVFHLAPTDWWLHVVLHIILGKPRVPEKYRARLAAWDPEESDRVAILAGARAFGLDGAIRPVLDDALAALDDPVRLAALRRHVRARLWRDPRNVLREARVRLAWSLGRPLGLRRGFTIAFIGPDGAGKSTMIEAFARVFTAMQIPVRSAYMGPWERGILPTRRLLRHFGAGPADELVPAHIAGAQRWLKTLKALIKRYAWYGHCWADMTARHLVRVLPHLLLRRTVLLDRYVHDLMVGFYNTPVENAKGLRRLICRLVPRPDFVILLDNDAEAIWRRKQEYDLETIRAALDRYRALAREHGFHVVRTDRPAECLAETFIRSHWRSMVALRRERMPGQRRVRT
jgi:thymidylate kinase